MYLLVYTIYNIKYLTDENNIIILYKHLTTPGTQEIIIQFFLNIPR